MAAERAMRVEKVAKIALLLFYSSSSYISSLRVSVASSSLAVVSLTLSVVSWSLANSVVHSN